MQWRNPGRRHDAITQEGSGSGAGDILDHQITAANRSAS
jgi:hypothetical protein